MDTFEIINVLANLTPKAYSMIQGDGITGTMLAYGHNQGTIIVVEAQGLPETACNQGIHGLHIHAGSSCTGTPENPFSDAGGHLNLDNCPHPYHTGDLPPLFAKDGNAWMAVYLKKFIPEQIIGHTIIIHAGIDDFTTQPSGNSGKMIACGQINELYQ